MARDLEEGPLVPKHAAGFGTDLLAAMWEPDACVHRTHPDFSKVQWQPRFNATKPCDERGGAFLYHSTMVADAFAAFRSDGTAGLYRGRLFDVDDKDSAAQDDMWARQPQIVNASFTTSVFDGKRIDTEVYKRRAIHVFAGSGNLATNGEVVTCHAYNALCVGGYVDHDTTGRFQDDTAGGSSWQNQFGREMPQVLGPYFGRKLATNSFSGGPPNYEAHSGTSFATPAVAGLAALLIANYPFDLKQQPEAVRAVLMASAQAHPVRSEGKTIPDFNDTIDDKMGVGAPNGTRAKKIMDEHTLRYGSFLPQLTGQPGLGLITFPGAANEQIRVVLTWDQCPDYHVGDPQLAVDLDMVVEMAVPSSKRFRGLTAIDGSGFYSNISRHDNWEIVEFTTRRAGTVAVHVSAPIFRPCPVAQNPRAVNYGLAWTKTAAPPMNVLTQ